MRSSKYHLYLTDWEYNSIVNAFINLKNALISQGKYTDGVDDVLIKAVSAQKKRFKVKSFLRLDSHQPEEGFFYSPKYRWFCKIGHHFGTIELISAIPYNSYIRFSSLVLQSKNRINIDIIALKNWSSFKGLQEIINEHKSTPGIAGCHIIFFLVTHK